jgi:hypothetical protein
MRVHISHLVFEPFRHANDEIVDVGADCAESSDAFAVAVVHLDVDEVLAWVAEADAQVAEVFGEFASRAFDCDHAGFDSDFD